jgi:excisionase family DNA binding protein
MNELISFESLPKAVGQLAERLESIETILKNKFQESTPKTQEEQLLTVEQAAKFLDLSIPTIYSKVSRGELPVMKRSKRLYFSNFELMAYLKEGRKLTNEELENEALKYVSERKKG